LFAQSDFGDFGVSAKVTPGDGDVVVRVSAGAEVQVRAVGRRGAPIPRAAVTMTAVDGVDVSTGKYWYTGDTGTATFLGPAGIVTLKLLTKDRARSVTVHVAGGTRTNVTIHIEDWPGALLPFHNRVPIAPFGGVYVHGRHPAETILMMGNLRSSCRAR
jgi:hypothetical protein